MATLADDGVDAARRDHRPGHFTGSAVVINPDGDVCLLFHRKLRRWLQPGGHADGDCDLGHVAWREACEETGLAGLRLVRPAIDLDIHRVAPPSEDAHLHFDVRFLVLAPTVAALPGNDESTAIRWVNPAELDRFDVDESVSRLVTSGLAVARQLAER